MKEIKWSIDYYDDTSTGFVLIGDCGGVRLVESVNTRWWGTNFKRKKSKIIKLFHGLEKC